VPTTERRIYRDGFTDGTRWNEFQQRPDDIVIATPAKCGTTWTQAIVASLMWPNGSAPGTLIVLSPWIDGRIEPAEAVAKRLDRQEHRRFIKTHTPADGVPWWPTTSYIVVLRDGRDAFMSLGNHMARLRPEIVAHINAETEKDGARPLEWTGDAEQDFLPWLESPDSAPAYLASWWPRRNEKNVLFVHYNDLKADLDGEMRRIASFLEVPVTEEQWPSVVERCTFEAMRAPGQDLGPFDMVFEGGIEGFLYKGTNGRWRDVLTTDQLRSYERRISDLLSPDAAAWLEQGSLALGRRP